MIHKSTSGEETGCSRGLIISVLFLFFATVFGADHLLHASPGDVDPAFDAGSGIDGEIYCVVAQTDGKVIIGGGFTTVRGAARNGIARLNADGTADTTFNPGAGANGTVRSIAVQTDGRALIGGQFGTINGVSRNGIARLNVDGSLDTTFNPGTGATFDPIIGGVSSIAVEADGKALIGGSFSAINGVSRNGIARLNVDGSLDTTFNPPGTWTTFDPLNGGVSSIAVQSDGKALIGVVFGSINKVSQYGGIARLNVDGSLDTTFNPNTGLYGQVYSIAVQTDGKVLIGGGFSAINGVSRNRIARLKVDGSLDTTFNPGAGANGTVRSIAVQTDGRALIGGQFGTINGVSRNGIARLNVNGSLDTTFNPGAGANGQVSSIAVQTDGKALIGGGLSTVNGVSRNRIARLNVNGSLDTTFNPGTGVDGQVSSIAMQTDGKALIGGYFSTINGVSRNRIARLNVNGSLDTTFNPGTGVDGQVSSIAMQTDGKALIGGQFGTINGVSRNGIARLNVDGSLDTTFNPGTWANGQASYIGGARSIAVQTDGKALIGVVFGNINNGIARLNVDGSLDTTFNPNTGANGNVGAIAVQTDGRALIGGYFSTINGTSRNGIARLNVDGSLDTTFNPPGTWATFDRLTGRVSSIAVQTDGKALIGVVYGSINEVSQNGGIARLNVDGSLDTTFNPNTGLYGGVPSIAMQTDGKALIGGYFSTINGTSRNGIARLNVDGSLDTTFNPGTGANHGVSSIAVQTDGNVLAGGDFTSINGVARWSVARLLGDSILSIDRVSPSPLPARNTRQWLSFRGQGFTPESQVTLRTGTDSYAIPSDRTEYVNSGEIRVFVNVTDQPARWSAEVKNADGSVSQKFGFEVVQPSGLVLANLTGTVKDNSGQPLGSVTVSVSQSGQLVRSALTSADGSFHFDALPAGAYAISASEAGYANQTQLASVWDTLDLQFRLAPAAVLPQANKLKDFPEIVPPSGIPGNLLLYANDNFTTDFSLLKKDCDTVVLTHGFRSRDDDWPSLFAKRIFNLLNGAGHPINILAWDWREAANLQGDFFLSLGQAQEYTSGQGYELGKALYSDAALGSLYKGRIHFIGHSLGTLVNAAAANYLHGLQIGTEPPANPKWDWHNTFMTLFDEAELAGLVNKPLLDKSWEQARVAVATFLKQEDLLNPDRLSLAATEFVINAAVIAASHITEAALTRKRPLPIEHGWADNYVSLVGQKQDSSVTVCLNTSFTLALKNTIERLVLDWQDADNARDLEGFLLFLETEFSLFDFLNEMHSNSWAWYSETMTKAKLMPSGNLGFYGSFEFNYLSPFSFPQNELLGTYWKQDDFSTDELALVIDPPILQSVPDCCLGRILADPVIAIGVGIAKESVLLGESTVEGVEVVGNVYLDEVDQTLDLWADTAAYIAQKAQQGYQKIAQVGSSGLRILLKPLLNLAGKQSGLRASATETTASNSVVTLSMVVPARALSVQFDYSVSGSIADNFIFFAINNTNTITLDGKFIPLDTLQKSLPFDVLALAGTTNTLTFGLSGGSSTNCTITIENITFIMDDPILSIRQESGQPVLSWPTAAADWELEMTETIPTGEWVPASSTPTLVGGSYRLQPTISSRKTVFYRLRRD